MPTNPPSIKPLLLFLAAIALLSFSAVQRTRAANYLVTNQAAARLGLERTWFAQVRVDPAEHKIVHWLLDKDQLFALTSAGTIQAINAETGETLWTTEVGFGHSPAAGIAVNSKYLALLGAARLYVMDRTDGHHLWSRQVGGAPTSAPALSNNYAYVTLTNGRVEAYRLDDSTANVWQYQSHGRAFQSPTTTGEVVSWPTDRGLLYVGSAETPNVLFRVETDDEIVTAPAEQAPFLFVASLDGYLYCFHELTGSEQWRYATGFAITSQPAIVGEKAYVASEGPSLHAVDAKTGQPLWNVYGVSQFAALGKHHTYGMNRTGTLFVLDNDSGGVAGRVTTGQGSYVLVNDQSDRIFIVNNRGLVQCLREIGATEPTWYRTPLKSDDEAKQQEDEAENPFETQPAEAAPEAGGGNPFTSDAAEEAEGGFDDFDDPNPFK